jgi:hypothetical protein
MADFLIKIEKARKANSRFLLLASVNFDHFGFVDLVAALPQFMPNRKVYLAGHVAACELAMAAKSPADMDRALLLEAAALHYYSDMFAAGHLRTPRKRLSEFCADPAVGNLMAKCGHDEDGYLGLNVMDAKGKIWRGTRLLSRRLPALTPLSRSLRRRPSRTRPQLVEQASGSHWHDAIDHPDPALPSEERARRSAPAPAPTPAAAPDQRAPRLRGHALWQDTRGRVRHSRGAQLGEDAGGE